MSPRCLTRRVRVIWKYVLVMVATWPRRISTSHTHSNDRIRAMAARRYVALQDDLELAPFIVEGRSTGRQLGGGSYGSVEEVGLLYANIKDLEPRPNLLKYVCRSSSSVVVISALEKRSMISCWKQKTKGEGIWLNDLDKNAD